MVCSIRPMRLKRNVTIFMLFLLAVSFLSSYVQGESADFDYSSIVNEIDINPIQTHIDTFQDFGSRVSGYPGSYSAAKYIYDAFNNYNLIDVQYQNYTNPVPVDYGAELAVLSPETVTMKAWPLWPNFLAPPVTPLGGVSGPLVYAGSGELKEFNGKKVDGSIVLMDFNSGDNWLSASNLGAKAVVFIEPTETTTYEAESKTIELSYTFPRIYVSKSDGAKLLDLLKKDPVTVHVKSSMKWEPLTLSNIIGFVKGTEYPDRIIVISAYYDSFSIVPSISPGASEACGVATLLDLAKFFQGHPAKYSLMFVAFSGHHSGVSGSTAFVEYYGFGKGWDELGKKIILQVNLDLSTDTRRLATVLSGGFSISGQNYLSGVMGKLTNYILYDLKNDVEKFYGKTLDVSDLRSSRSDTWTKDFPVAWMLDSEESATGGMPSFSFVSANDFRLYRSTTLDTKDRLDFENLEEQLRFIYPCIYALVNTEDLYEKYLFPWKPMRVGTMYMNQYGFSKVRGTISTYNYTRGWYTPISNVLVAITKAPARVLGGPTTGIERPMHMMLLGFTDVEGNFAFTGLPTSIMGVGGFRIIAYEFNSTGHIVSAPDLGKYARARPNFVCDVAEPDLGQFVIFRCGQIVLFDIVDPMTMQLPFDASTLLEVNDFTTHTRPDKFGVDGYGNPQNGRSVCIVYSPPEIPIEILVKTSYAMRFPLAVLGNGTRENPEGSGFSVDKQITLTHTVLRYAEGLHLLDEVRISKLDLVGVKNVVRALRHDEATQLIEEAHAAIETGKYDLFYQYSTAAWKLERDIYIPTRVANEDAVNAVQFFGAILIPFAFLLSSLLYEKRGMRQTLLSIIIYFSSVITLSQLHPGFTLASNIIMVLLGFAILVLIMPVFSITFNSFFGVIKHLRRIRSGVHEAEAEKASAMTMAFSVSTRNMKGRRIRTMLFFATIVLIIISLVSFTSLEPLQSFKPLEITGKTPYEGVMVRQTNYGFGAVNWLTANILGVGDNVVEVVKASYGDQAIIAPRTWMYRPITPSVNSYNLENATGARWAVAAVLGMTPEANELFSLNGALVAGRWFIPSDEWTCVISKSTADALGITSPGEKVKFEGIDMVICGIIDQDVFDAIQGLDSRPLTPLNLGLPAQIYTVHHATNTIIILPYETAKKLPFYNVMCVDIGFKNNTDLVMVGSQIFERFGLETFVSTGGRLLMYSRATSYKVMGIEYQITPVVIAILVMFNVMLGMVYERTREIGIYSAVGLSPKHVGAVFLAEAATFAVIGSVIGYILAMVTCKVGQIMVPGVLQLNYASSWVLMAVIMAMVVVVLSSILPITKASSLVTPSMERVWRIPTKPSEKLWDIPLPFVTSTREETLGVVSYVEEYLSGHVGERAPDFTIRNLWHESSKDQIVVGMDMLLSPYELGIRQKAQLSATRSAVEARYAFNINIERTSGETGPWITSNRIFLDALRKQLLLWKSLKPDERLRTIQRASERIEEKGKQPHV